MGRLWREPALQLRTASESLELPLLPSPRLRSARRLLLSLIGLYVLELLWTGHWLAALLTVLAATTFRHRRASVADPCCLVLAADGRLFLRRTTGLDEEVRLSPASLRLGLHLLLVLRGKRSTIRLLLGPDNLAPVLLAALKRRLPSGTVVLATALHSVAAQGSKAQQP